MAERPLFSTSATSADNSDTATNSTTTSNNDYDAIQEKRFHERKEKRYKERARERRKRLVGMAKAVDRGQFTVTYNPGGVTGTAFKAISGLPDRTKPFTVLGIESSCDDTGAAVVRSDGVIMGEALASQTEIHEEFGGVVPGLAKDAHADKIDSVIQEALESAGLESVADVDAVGVTVGPGLEICLRVGCNKARDLACQHKKPFVGIHHLEAHILMARLPLEDAVAQGTTVTVPATETTHESQRALEFPFLSLLVSGGHCQLMKCIGIGQYTIIGGTIDDSLGEAYDKTARLLGLKVGGGGGPAVEKLALDGDPNSVKLSVPMQRRKDFDFSYAGLKTQIRMSSEKLKLERNIGDEGELSYEDRANIAASFQNVAIKHIEQRLRRAMELMEKDGIRSLAVVGGVAANKELRLRLDGMCAEREWKMFVPPPRLCTDQGAMSAWAAIERLMVGSSDEPEGAEVYARYPFAAHEQN